MKTLNLLKPKLIKGFLEDGKGEKVEYLQVTPDLTLEALKEDLDSGALAFKEIYEGAKKALSRVVVIQSNNKENAFMAVNYLAGICNNIEGMEDDEDDFASYVSDEYDFYYDEYDEADEYEDDEYNDYVWNESPSRIPVITAEELLRYGDSGEIFLESGFASMGMPNVRNKKPYWMNCTKESICILADVYYSYSFFYRFNIALERFKNNKHIFVVLIADNIQVQNNSPFMFGEFSKQDLLEFILDNTADMFCVETKEEDLKKYRLLQFEGWAKQLGVKFNKKFPKNEIVEQITSLRNPEKSLMMEKVFSYVLKENQKTEGAELTKEDFAVMKKFDTLRVEEKKEKNNAKKLEEELIGMESVKTQVKNIVNVMKFNKLREKMGVGKSGFHNVHLLIGAPGTAKTTVAQFLGAMMFEENLLPGNRFISVNGADLKGMYVGHSAPKTHHIFENHDVILIDEAYSLAASDGSGGVDTFSQEAIAQLILEIENHSTDKLVMFAGYGGVGVSEKNNKMKQFIDANPGLKSRINSTIYFDSYSPSQMVEIVHSQAKIQKFVVSKDADEDILEYFKTRVGEQNFGNGREARSLLENAMVFAANRIMSLPAGKRTKKMMSEINKEDIRQAVLHMTNNNMMQIGRKKEITGFSL